MSEKKEAIRKAARERRGAISADKRAEWEAAIRARVRGLLNQSGLDTLLSYISTPEEVDTRVFLQEWLDAGKRAFAPAIDDVGLLEWRMLTSLENLTVGTYGIPEPPPQTEVALFDPHAPILVPCVAFNEQCHRIGYGGGYFDRFLVNHKGPSIAVAFECQRFDFEPELLDVPVSLVATEEKCYEN